MTSHQDAELDPGTAGSVASSPRGQDSQFRVRLMCSFGGRIMPRPSDNNLRYVGGDTRIVAVHRSVTYSALLTKLSKLAGTADISVKYQLPNEDLDALISVTTDEDVENMMEEYERSAHSHNPRSARLRLFLFSTGEEAGPGAGSMSSLLEGSANRENWFFDALNSGGSASAASLERRRSEASSLVSEPPDYLFGLDNWEENPRREAKTKAQPVLQDSTSAMDPGSPAPVVPSPFGSTPSPDLSPAMAKTKSESSPEIYGAMGPQAQPKLYVPENSAWAWQCGPDPVYSSMPVYYVPGPPGNAVVQVPGQMVVTQASGGGVRIAAALPPYEMRGPGSGQQIYYGLRNAGMVRGYPGVDVPGEGPSVGTNPKTGGVSQP